MDKPIYLDYSATYPYVKYPSSTYGSFLNPNANYAYKEKRLLSEAENRVKKAIGAKGGKVIFGGTSSQLIENLMASVAEETNLYYIVCSSYEHDSCFRFHQGTVRDTVLLNGLLETFQDIPNCSDQLFILWQGVNNITGEIFPVVDIGNACHKYNAFYICDMTAMIGKTPIPPNIDQWCDCAVWSGHKLGTELGIGAMWISDRLDKWLNGFKLHGTPNLAGALALTQAVEDSCKTDVIMHYNGLYDVMFDTLKKYNVDFQIISNGVKSCAINAIRLPGFNARVLQSYLASKGIYIGLGQSSCADKADRRVLCQGYGLSEQEADEVIRISFGESSNYNEVHELVEKIIEFKQMFT